MHPIARTNVQLYNQLRRAGCPTEELALVRRSYDLAVELYSGYFQADGAPFVSHVTGVASIVAHLGLSSEVVAAACIHNVYANGDFGDGQRGVATPYRRQVVRDAAGYGVEAYVHRFRERRSSNQTMRAIPKRPERLDALDVRDRHFVAMELADILEQYVDGGFLYYGDSGWLTEFVTAHQGTLIELARLLGYPQLATALDEAFTAATAEAIPEVLTTEHKYLRLVMPRSYRLRSRVALRQMLSRAKDKTRAWLG